MTSKIFNENEIIPKIKQNNNTFFEIKKSKKWNYSIEIIIKPYQKINIDNLFYIIKSYLNNKEILCIGLSIAWEVNEKRIILENNRINKIKKMDNYQFEEWIYFIFFTDKKYDPNKIGVICIILTFSKKMIENYNKSIDVLSYLRPKLPIKKKIFKNKINILFKKFPQLLKFIK